MNSEPYHPSYRERKSEADIHDAWYNIDWAYKAKHRVHRYDTLSSENRVLLIETVLAKEQEAEREYTCVSLSLCPCYYNICKGNEKLTALQSRFTEWGKWCWTWVLNNLPKILKTHTHYKIVLNNHNTNDTTMKIYLLFTVIFPFE
jgi:hypothetical protein